MWSYPFNAQEKKIRWIHFFAAAAILTGSVGNGHFVFVSGWERQKWFWYTQPVTLQRCVLITLSLKFWDCVTKILSAIVQSCSQASHLLVSYLPLLLQAARMGVWGQMMCVVPSWGEVISVGLTEHEQRGCVPWRMSQKAGQMQDGFCLFFFLLPVGDLGSWDQCILDLSLCNRALQVEPLEYHCRKGKGKTKSWSLCVSHFGRVFVLSLVASLQYTLHVRTKVSEPLFSIYGEYWFWFTDTEAGRLLRWIQST